MSYGGSSISVSKVGNLYQRKQFQQEQTLFTVMLKYLLNPNEMLGNTAIKDLAQFLWSVAVGYGMGEQSIGTAPVRGRGRLAVGGTVHIAGNQSTGLRALGGETRGNICISTFNFSWLKQTTFSSVV